MLGRIVLGALLLVLLLVVSCSDNGTIPEELVFNNITSADALNILTFFDPDDWCYGGIILTEELVILAPEIEIFAADVGDSGSTMVHVFNYSYHDRMLVTYSEDTVITYDQYEVLVPSLTWATFTMTYHAYTEDIYEKTVRVHVEPAPPVSEDLYIPVKGYPSPILYAHFAVPLIYSFRNCYPNPTFEHTRFQYSLPDRANVRLTVRGPDKYFSDRYVLVDEVRDAGWHFFDWDVTGLESGIYRAYIEIGDDFECYGDVFVNPGVAPLP